MMTLDEMRDQMGAYRRQADVEAIALKDSQRVLDRLYSLYSALSEREQQLANQVICEWVLAHDEGLRFDALALIDKFKIREATSALQELAFRLAASTTPSAPYELRKVGRVASSLV